MKTCVWKSSRCHVREDCWALRTVRSKAGAGGTAGRSQAGFVGGKQPEPAIGMKLLFVQGHAVVVSILQPVGVA